MKIGIITFHWGANHGAVLQAYALSEYLRTQYGAQVEIIDYCPKKLEINVINALKSRSLKRITRKLCELKKEKRIRPFRNMLSLSRRYYLNETLISSKLPYDILIAGSDQIWNPSFLKSGEGKITPVYFLNFGNSETIKLSVSASFGCEVFPSDCQEIAYPLLADFQEISVRENTGKEILKHMGLDAVVTADPTALLTGEQYLNLCSRKNVACGIVSKMILRHQSKEVNELIDSICDYYSVWKIINIEKKSIPEWLTAIKNSQMVITNSFHCVMMCLKLHTPFVVILEKGHMSGMNDRFKTLLDIFDLKERIVNSVEDLYLLPADIDFERVDAVMNTYADSLKVFLERNIC